MAERNCTQATEFSLTGFSENLVTQDTLFLMFLLTYLATILGNLGMIVLIKASPQLHSPMYYFLGNLAFVDLCSSTVITPKMLVDFVSEKKGIAYAGCVAQFFFFAVFGTMEAILLAVMAYDRYVAICEPLHYLAAMSHGVGVQLVVGSYAAGSLNALVHTSTLLRLSFCGPNLINHFYCDIPPLLLLSCSDTWLNKVVMASCIGFIITTSVLAIGISYTCILFTTWSIRSVEGRHKAFSTCSSHLMAVALFYGSAAFLYFHSFSRHAEDQGKIASVFYTVVTPMLNPFIYSLRNKEVRDHLHWASCFPGWVSPMESYQPGATTLTCSFA
ncbi:unnamed protein product [Bubo scandiacus]